MSENLKNLIKYTLDSYHNCNDEKYSKVLGKISNLLLGVAHENGLQYEVSKILDELEQGDTDESR
jgi:hypothetical protein